MQIHAAIVVRFDARRVAACDRPRVRSITAEGPPVPAHDGAAVNRRNNHPANGRPTDAPSIVGASRAIHDGVGFGNGERHQQGDDCIFHLRAPSMPRSDIIVSLVASSHGKEELRLSSSVLRHDRFRRRRRFRRYRRRQPNIVARRPIKSITANPYPWPLAMRCIRGLQTAVVVRSRLAEWPSIAGTPRSGDRGHRRAAPWDVALYPGLNLSDQEGAAVGHQSLAGHECLPHQVEIALGDLLRFGDMSHR
jgi:hypothetical protein